MKVYIKKSPTANFETIDVKDQYLGKGGQGSVHNILTSQYSDYCLKKFKDPAMAKREYDRIAFMVQNPPKNIMGSPSFRICWPVALAYDTNKIFIGYVMPLAFPKSRDLLILSTYSSKPISQQAKYKKFPEWFDKYELTSATGIKNRVKMLHNWAIAMYCIHETGKYTAIDLKPENIMATGTGKISVVDTDSFQIAQNGKILFPATARTPGYCAPELTALVNSGKPLTEACDRFAMAVCFYKVLNGVHPYSGTILKPPYDTLTEEQQCIDNGLFAFGDKSQYISFCQGFNPQQNFHNLPPSIQALFKRAFGSNPANRPSMEEWGKALHEAAGDSISISGSKVIPKTSTDSVPFKITKVVMCNTDQKAVMIGSEGSTLYNDVSYLTPMVYYDVLTTGDNIEVWYKLIAPDGRLEECNQKSGFTWKGNIVRDTKGARKIQFGGWGNNEKNYYNKKDGKWIAEFYYGGKCIYSTTFIINNRIYKTSTDSVPFKITKVVMCDTDKQSALISSEGSTLYDDVSYLTPMVYYDVLTPGANIEVWYKLFSPDGRLDEGNQKNGFTWKGNIARSSTGARKIQFGGWGNTEKNHYKDRSGQWRAEFYYSGKCIYSTTFSINKRRVSPPPPPPTNKWKWIAGIAAALIAVYFGWKWIAVPLIANSNAPKYYVIADRTSVLDENNKPEHELTYGTQVAMYKDMGAYIEGEGGGEKGLIASQDLITEDDFHLLQSVWEGEDELNAVNLPRYRKAVLDFIKQKGLLTGAEGYQLDMTTEAGYPNAILISHEVNGYDIYRDFSFILSNKNTGKALTAIYSFSSDGEPILVHDEETEADKDITGVQYRKWSRNKYKVNYASKKETVAEKVKSTKAHIWVTGIEFADATYENKIVRDYGSKLYSNTQYLKPKIQYTGLKKRNSSTIYVKIYRPDATLIQGQNSPRGYTYSCKVNYLDRNSKKREELPGWGNKEGTVFPPGEYLVEIWNNNVKLAAKSVYIYPLDNSEAKPLISSNTPAKDDDKDNKDNKYVKKDEPEDKPIEEKEEPVKVEKPKDNDVPVAVKKEEKPATDTDMVYSGVEVMPQYPGGQSALNRYLSANIRYPQVAQENGVQGRVVVQFVITRTGEVTNVKVLRGVDPHLDKEAVRVCKSLPRFIPGKQNGVPVNVRYQLPVSFKLN